MGVLAADREGTLTDVQEEILAHGARFVEKEIIPKRAGARASGLSIRRRSWRDEGTSGMFGLTIRRRGRRSG